MCPFQVKTSPFASNSMDQIKLWPSLKFNGRIVFFSDISHLFSWKTINDYLYKMTLTAYVGFITLDSYDATISSCQMPIHLIQVHYICRLTLSLMLSTLTVLFCLQWIILWIFSSVFSFCAVRVLEFGADHRPRLCVLLVCHILCSWSYQHGCFLLCLIRRWTWLLSLVEVDNMGHGAEGDSDQIGDDIHEGSAGGNL